MAKKTAKQKLIEAKLLQEMINVMPEKLVQDSKQIVELVDGVLIDATGAEDSNSEDQEGIVSIAFKFIKYYSYITKL